MIDYYNEFRGTYKSWNEQDEFGSFDPITLAVTFSSAIELGLDWHTEITTDRIIHWGTYLHENMHWWQSIGTTYGIVKLLSSATQSFAVFRETRKISNKRIAKPLHRFLEEESSNLEYRKNLNIAVNTWMDIEFTYGIMENPVMHGERICNSKFFSSIEHSTAIYLSQCLHVLSSSFPNSDFIDNLTDDFFKEISLFQNENSSSLYLSPIGADAISESAARITEMQYIQQANNGGISWFQWRRLGYLDAKYLDALNAFLTLTELDIGDNICSSSVYLFLVICDIALNPSAVYPVEVHCPKELAHKTHPGFRFLILCRLVNRMKKLNIIKTFSVERDAHKVVDELCGYLDYNTPIEIARKCVQIYDDLDSQDRVIIESTQNYQVTNENFVIRYLYAKHIQAMRQRLETPLFFSVPSLYTEGDETFIKRTGQIIDVLAPPFIRRPNKRGELSLPIGGKITDQMRLFHSTLMKWLMLINLGRQLVAKGGPFNFTFPWADPTRKAFEYKAFVEGDFRKNSGYDFSDIAIISN